MIEIRSCSGLHELDACVQLQTDTWGYDETEIVPRKTFLLAQKIGGQVLGAFDGENLIGFVFSLPGIKNSGGQATPYLHSHMLAVRPEFRNSGVGAQLKRTQRAEALSRGIRYMEWTFDPLEIKNAFLNIHRLGAICRSYRPDFYGVSSSRLQGGLPTDRLLAEWELDSHRVEQILEGHSPEVQFIEERILVPASIEQWKANESERNRALAAQSENRNKFQQAFARGLAVLGFSRDSQGNGIFELGPLTPSE
jgi:predicted GNAT superfamily acetyltransferase